MKIITVLCCLLMLQAGSPPTGIAYPADSERHYFKAAVEAASWIRSTAVKTPHGTVWPADAENPAEVSTNITFGLAGHVLFFLELTRASRDRQYLEDARRGADYLAATLPAELNLDATPSQHSFYTGVAGVGFALHEAFKATGEQKYRRGALRCVELLHKHARKEGGGVAWVPFNDLLFGNAGNGLFLLYAAREMNHAASRDLAVQVGRRLVEKAMPEHGGLNWKFRDDQPMILPNFSHGTAGISYFLATLYMQTRQKEFLDGALAGARYLQAIAKTEGGVFLVPYGWPAPQWKDYYDIGWAHGPAGTARLFYRLWQITEDPVWMDVVKGCARGIKRSGLPGSPAPGFGTEPFKIDMRFGAASVADFFINLYRATGDRQYLDDARPLVEDLLKKATRDAKGLRWVYPQYVFMAKPGAPAAFTGYFYGAAGLGMLLLRLDAAARGEARRSALPDDPFTAMIRPK